MKESQKKTIQIQSKSSAEVIDIDLAEFDLSWEIVETNEREMGTERLHEAEFDVDYGNSNETIRITLQVWEYPVGVCNDEEILVDGYEVLKKCDIGDLALSDSETYEED